MLEIPQDPGLVQDDMTGLLQQALTKDTDKVTFRQGTVLEWDAVTSVNKIQYLGVTIENMPILVGGSPVVMVPGDNVAILSVGKNAFVIGKILTPTP